MKKNFRERTRDFFIKLGQKNSVLRVFAMIGLAASMLIFRFAEYCRTGGKRFACALFILCCFFTGNSFAYPVFYMDRGFISEEEPLLPEQDEPGIIPARGMQPYMHPDKTFLYSYNSQFSDQITLPDT